MIAGKSVSSREIQHLELSNLNHQRARFRRPNHQEVMKVIHSAPGLELWQLHFSELSGQKYTVPGIDRSNAHTERAQNGVAYWIKVSAQADGSFTVTNGPNGFSKSYQAH